MFFTQFQLHGGDDLDEQSSTSSSDTDEYDVPQDIPVAKPSRSRIRVALRDPAPRPKRPAKEKRKWVNKDIPTEDKERFEWHIPNVDTSRLPQTPDGIFSLFFDDDIVNMIVQQSIHYAGLKGNHSFRTSPQEIRVFFAILLISGYNTVPRRRMYWSRDDDVRNLEIANAMSRNRFDTLVRYVHLSDNNNLDVEDKFSKVRPLLAMLNERFLMYFLKEKNLSIDESMIPYYGRHGAKQFIRGKPIRFGYKMWALTTSLGYALQFEPYQGARGHQTHDPHFLGMGGAVVMDLLSELQKDNGYHLTFDNLFTSLKLVDRLTDMGIACTGTIRSNRVEDCPVKNVKEMSKTPRGTLDQRYDADHGLIVVRWNDNNIVNVVSNCHGVEPIQQASRWSKQARARISLPQPYLIRHYNQTMGGVDRMDQNVEKYRVSIRSKKWWWPIFMYCLDLSVQQTWHIYRSTPAGRHSPLDLLGIRRAVVTVLLAQGRSSQTSPGRPRAGPMKALSKRVPDEVRLDGLNHFAQPSKERRCSLCRKKCRTQCSKCNIGLHRKCFEEFHTV